jgi:tRNA threonylcarbamoyladenosine biosynthesis protein TsaB
VATGNARSPYAGRLNRLPAESLWVDSLPTAAALLALAPAMIDQAVPAEQALPLYVRDKVALTTEERTAAKAAGQAAA